MELIKKYFPHITSKQEEQFSALGALYEEWNSQINVISRKDMDHFYERHVLHSLGIAKVFSFPNSAEVLDVGTGGGFPGVPLAILFPHCNFLLVDSIGKKIKVVDEISRELRLGNVEAIHQRAEKVRGKYHFVVSRAVTQLPRFLPWIRGKYRAENIDPKLPNGLLYLKGGDISEELMGLGNYKIHELKNYFEEEFFETKKVLYLPARQR